MKETSVTDRLTFLAETFDIFECKEKGDIEKKLEALKNGNGNVSLVKNDTDKVLAILSVKPNESERFLKKISICSDVFSAMIAADPTENKMYLQWMLTVFTQLIKGKKDTEGKDVSTIASAIRFVDEDLPQAKDYLILFENNKRKKKFKELCKASFSIKHIKDPTNINQYTSLSQLFDAVDPFIEKNPSAVERTLFKFVELGQAVIPVHDRKFMVYIPKTTEASVVFANYAGWCTARVGNGNFNSYTNTKKPNGKNSDIYIIINNKFFTEESQELYQIHFESGQLKDRNNGGNVSIFDSVLSESEGVSNFFKEELLAMAKGHKKGLDENKYLDFLVSFGFAESLFELYAEDTQTIRFMTREIPRLPDISRFKILDQLIITNAKLVDIHPSIGKLNNLQILSLPNNQIKVLPKEVGQLKKLEFLNLTGNPITEFPSEMAYLDKSRGGSLHRIGVKKDEIGAENYQRLKELLPTTEIS